MKTMETTEEVSSDGIEKRAERRNWRKTPPGHRKNEARTENLTCKSVEQVEDHEKCLRWSWARNHIGNPD
jgi:hypothetical protein